MIEHYKDGTPCECDKMVRKYFPMSGGPLPDRPFNGQLYSELPYVNKKANGERRAYWENGFLKSRIDYKDGKKHGHAKEYFWEQDFEGQVGISTEYAEGKKCGHKIAFWRNNKTWYEKNYDLYGQKHGLQIFYNVSEVSKGRVRNEKGEILWEEEWFHGRMLKSTAGKFCGV